LLQEVGLRESPQHVQVKELLEEKLRDRFGSAIQEYPSTGHELDVFSISSSGIDIYVEIIWAHSKLHFQSDIIMLHESDAKVKVVVSSPEIIADSNLLRTFNKGAKENSSSLNNAVELTSKQVS
jgi:hypothetical protein